MTQYGCAKCGSTGSVMEMRSAVVFIGPGKELQCSGIVPVQRCSNGQCNAMSTPTNLTFGAPVNLVPAPLQPPADTGESQSAKMERLLKMKKAIAELEDDLVDPPADDTDEEGEPPWKKVSTEAASGSEGGDNPAA